MTPEDHRQPTALEKAIVERLLLEDIPDAKILKEQLSSCHVRVMDEFGSFRFEPIKEVPIWPIAYSGPLVTAYQADRDTSDVGPFINFILFVDRGLIKELQIYKDDGAKPRVGYDPKKFVLITTNTLRP